MVSARDGEGEVWLAVEVSMAVDTSDIHRARGRAKILDLLQPRVRPCGAGRSYTDASERELAADPGFVAITLARS